MQAASSMLEQKSSSASTSHGSRAGAPQPQLRVRSRRLTPLSRSTETRSTRSVEKRLLRGLEALPDVGEESWEHRREKKKKTSGTRNPAAFESARSACQTSSSEQADYSIFLAPAVLWSRLLDKQIGGVFRRVRNNHRLEIQHVAGHRASQLKELLVCGSHTSNNGFSRNTQSGLKEVKQNWNQNSKWRSLSQRTKTKF